MKVNIIITIGYIWNLLTQKDLKAATWNRDYVYSKVQSEIQLNILPLSRVNEQLHVNTSKPFLYPITVDTIRLLFYPY